MAGPEAASQLSASRVDDTVVVCVAGDWRLGAGLPATDAIARLLVQAPPPRRLTFATDELAGWDSSLLVVVERLLALARGRVEVDRAALPEGIRRLLALSEAPTIQRPPPPAPRPPLTARIGLGAIELSRASLLLLTVVGETALSLVHLVIGRARVRTVDVLGEIQGAGAESLPIVTVVSFLLGMILAFVGGVTLRPFGATLYVANVVTVSMVRELGPVMTAIVMSGRTGSAYAAQLGTMKVTQEIDALTTMALPPTEFLVLPRVLALSLMLPLLNVYADFTALVGGGLVASASGASNLTEYVRQSRESISLVTFWVGILKSISFGGVVALCGCFEGLRAGTSAASVGQAATAAVVSSIVWIIAIDGLFAVALYLLGI